MNEARKNGYVKENLFGVGKYRIPFSIDSKEALSREDAKRIGEYVDKNPRTAKTTERYRDLWLFSYYCNGINFVDMLQLKYSNIIKVDDCYTIQFYRSKTKTTAHNQKPVIAVILPQMQAIIEKWGNPDYSKDSYIFNYLTGTETPEQKNNICDGVKNRTNTQMKKIAKELGIKQNVTCYVARHTYSTVMNNSGAPLSHLSENLGHSSIATTQTYITTLNMSARNGYAKNLIL
jgi:integrase